MPRSMKMPTMAAAKTSGGSEACVPAPKPRSSSGLIRAGNTDAGRARRSCRPPVRRAPHVDHREHLAGAVADCVLAHHSRVCPGGDGARLAEAREKVRDARDRFIQPLELNPFAARLESLERMQPPVRQQESAAGRYAEAALGQPMAHRVAVLASRAEAEIDARTLDQLALLYRRKRPAPGVDERLNDAAAGEPLRKS